MTTNYIQPGRIIDTVCPAAVASGAVMIVGSGIRVALTAGAAAATIAASAEGVFSLAANPAEAWVDGIHLYWDGDNNWLTAVAGAFVYAGCAARAHAAAETTAWLHLAQGAPGTSATTTAAPTTTAGATTTAAATTTEAATTTAAATTTEGETSTQ